VKTQTDLVAATNLNYVGSYHSGDWPIG
jgi:hypothetical protein